MASIQDLGDGKYKLYVELGYRGKRRLRRTKTIYAKNITEARKELVRFEASLMDKKITDEEKITTDEFYVKWKKLYAKDHYSPRQYKEVCRIIDNRILPEFTTAKLKEITRLDVISFIKSLKRVDGKGDLAPSTINNIYKAFNSLMSVAKDWDLIDDNPCKNIKLPSSERKEMEVYNVEETKELFERLEGEQWNWQLIVKIAALTGARQGEIVALENKHLDFNNKTITIEQSLSNVAGQGLILKGTKTGNKRTITVSDSLMIELNEYTKEKKKQLFEVQNLREWKGHTFLFSNEFGRPLRPDTVSQWWLRFMDKHTDLKRIRFHDLRHTSATLLLQQGVHAKVIQKRLGHSKVTFTLDVYSHVLEEMDRTASNVLDDLFASKSDKNDESDAK